MKRQKKQLIALLIIFLFLLLASCQWFKRAHFSGYTDTLYVYLSSPSSGYLLKRHVLRGDPVKAGQLLYEIDPQPELAQKKAAKAYVHQMLKTLEDLKRPRRKPEIAAIENQIFQLDRNIEKTQKHYERLLALSKKQYVDPDTVFTNQKMVEELRFEKKQLEENLKLSHLGSRLGQIEAQAAAVLGARAKLKEVNWYIKHKKSYAPNDGYIFDTFYVEGELVGAAKPVMSMVVPENNFVEFFVSSHDVFHLKIGQTIFFRFYGEKVKHSARIHFISQTMEYMPPVLFTQDYQEELVYRIRAKPEDKVNFLLGQPVDVWL